MDISYSTKLGQLRYVPEYLFPSSSRQKVNDNDDVENEILTSLTNNNHISNLATARPRLSVPRSKSTQYCTTNRQNGTIGISTSRSYHNYKMSLSALNDCGASTVGSSCAGSESRHDSQLDVRLMRTLNDVKFKNRPKCIFFSDVNFQRECLDAHNAVRQRHGCAPLEWSQELADLARTWAEKMAEGARLLYPEIAGVGDNLFMGTASEINHLPRGVEITQKWADEGDKVDFDRPKWRLDTAHFTQIVWRDTNEMGCSRCWLPAKNLVAIVAFYRPVGNSNLPGDFCQQVPRPLTPTELKALDSAIIDHSPIGALPGAFHSSVRISSPTPPSVMSEPNHATDRSADPSSDGMGKKSSKRTKFNFFRNHSQCASSNSTPIKKNHQSSRLMAFLHRSKKHHRSQEQQANGETNCAS